MENEHSSSSDISIDLTGHTTESLRDIVDRCKELSNDERKEADKTDHDLVLDLRSVLPGYDPVSENDESMEKLSAVLEQPEDSSLILDSAKSSQDYREDKEIHCILRERINSLNEVMRSLKEELKEELELWRREREEFQRLRDKDDALALEEATAAARAAAAAYAAESPLSNNLDMTSEDALRELTILEYEKRLAKYQDEFSLSQAEIRYNARWKQIANAFKKKLMDVERLCNEELEKVQQNANNLQPLKEMVTQWYTDEENHGDTVKTFEFGINAQKYNKSDAHDRYNFQKTDAEVNMAPEIFAARFKSDELTAKDRFYG